MVCTVLQQDLIFFLFQIWLTEVSSNSLFRTNWNVGTAAKVWESIMEPKEGIRNPSRLPKTLFIDTWKPVCMHVGRQNQLGCVATCTIPTCSRVIYHCNDGRKVWCRQSHYPLCANIAIVLIGSSSFWRRLQEVLTHDNRIFHLLLQVELGLLPDGWFEVKSGFKGSFVHRA